MMLCAFLLAVPFVGDRPFATRGEPREALVAQSMLLRGDWLLGSGYGGSVPSKPPLMHWLIAGLSSLTGEVNEWTSRLPSAAASILFAGVWFVFLRRRSSSEVATLSTLLLITSIEWCRAATGCRVDMILSVFFVLGVLGLFRWWEQGWKGYPFFTMLSILAATLVKGPVALALPALFFGTFLLLRKENISKIIFACSIIFVPALLGASIWYVLAYFDRGPDFFHKVYYENIARLSSTQEDAPHKHSAVYLYGMLLLGFLPWTLLLFRNLKNFVFFISTQVANSRLKKSFEYFKTINPFSQFSVICAIGLILFFSIPQGKRSVYLLPAYPFISYGLAKLFIKSRYQNAAATVTVVRVIAAALGTIAAALTLFPAAILALAKALRISIDANGTEDFILRLGREPLNLEIWWIGLIALCFTVALLGKKILKDYRAIPVFFIALNVCLAGSCLRFIADQTSSKDFAAQIGSQVDSQASLFSFGNEFYDLSFYLKREVTTITGTFPTTGYVFAYLSDEKALREKLAPGGDLQLIARSTHAVDKPGFLLGLYKLGVSN